MHAPGQRRPRASRRSTADQRRPRRASRPLIDYDDDSGHHPFDVATKDSVTIGRGGIAYPVDIRIVSSPDVSREHARSAAIRATGRFFLIDLSSLGTTLNGRHVPRGYDEVDGAKRENGAETPLPDRARSASPKRSFSSSRHGCDDALLLWARFVFCCLAASSRYVGGAAARMMRPPLARRSRRAPCCTAAAGDTDPGLQREVNEDRFHVDPARGLFIVIDGVGGPGRRRQGRRHRAVACCASGSSARPARSPNALAKASPSPTTRSIASPRLRPNGTAWPACSRWRSSRTARATSATSATRGSTSCARGRIEKVTRDHSPVGEREDAGEISEREAMRHPRRNEVYRDVGSEPHEPRDPDFIDVTRDPVRARRGAAAVQRRPDRSGGLGRRSTSRQPVRRRSARGRRALIDAANAAGGKDNVTVVYVEGETFAASGRVGGADRDHPAARRGRRASDAARRIVASRTSC